MKSRFSIFALFVLCCCACAQQILPPASGPASEPVTLTIVVQEAARTRTTDEEALRDVNLYLFGRTNHRSAHVYSVSSSACLEIAPGEYDLYAIGNRHDDMGTLTAAQLLASTADRRDDSEDLLMSGHRVVAIASSPEPVVVQVRRHVAKIAYNIRVADTAPDLDLRSVQLCSVPRSTALFATSAAPSTSAEDFTDGRIVEVPDAARRNYSGVQYLFENPQGVVGTIAEQRDKNAANAPACASYLRIRAVRGSRTLDYRIYLGRNNTTDFNVLRNTAQTLDVTISGDNETDTRVHGYAVTVADDFEDNRLGGYCVLPYNAALDVCIERKEAAPQITGVLEVLTPTDGPFLVDYDPCDPRCDLSLYDQQGTNCYELVYYPRVVTEANARLAYEVRMRDSYGFENRYRFGHRFANEICVAPGVGRVSAAGALHVEESAEGGLRAACYENGCAFTAHDSEGFDFAGWYADAACTELLSSSPTYTHRPRSPHDEIYTRYEARRVHILTDIYTVHFECDGAIEVDQDEESFLVPCGAKCRICSQKPALLTGWYDAFDKSSRRLISAEKQYTFIASEDRIVAPDYTEGADLSAAGTANCYIAPEHGTAYMFDATTQGNGCATTGIAPQPLRGGVSARLIWQTGSVPEAVVREIGYDGRRISFRTGPEYGNALIGLFDRNGVCIWSWHIWATDADLVRTSRLYSTGARFMGRNLGAETEDWQDHRFRGMYYEWGRKDPFPYPAAQSGSAMTAVHCGEGFSFTTCHPRSDEQITPAWAAAHPTTFIAGVENASGTPAYSTSWLAQPSPNLWGNASTGYTYSPQSAKSIYDPCPPGWKLPGPEAWDLDIFKGREAVSGYGWYMIYDSIGNSIYHPYVGELSAGASGDASFSYTTLWGHLWTNAPGLKNPMSALVDAPCATGIDILSSGVAQQSVRKAQAVAYPVRCIKE